MQRQAEQKARETAPSQAHTSADHIRATGLALALSGAFLYSWKPIFIKLLFLHAIDPSTQLALRMGLALPFYGVIAVRAWLDRRRRGLETDFSKPMLLRTIGIGMLGYYVSSYLDVLGLERITAQFERLILYTYPSFVAMLGFWFYGERLTRAHILALGLTYVGLAVIFVKDLHSLGPQVASGTAFVLVCSFTYSLYLIWSKLSIDRMGSQLFTCISMMSGTSLILLHFALTHPLSGLLVDGQVLWLSLGIAIIATVVPSFLMAEAIARIGPSMASVAGGSGPVMTSLLAIWIVGEPFTPWHLAGMALVIGGVLALTRKQA